MERTDEATRNPLWLVLLQIAEALAWLSCTVVGAPFAFFIIVHDGPMRTFVLVIYAFMYAACLANGVIFSISAFKKSTRPVVDRVGIVHNTAAAVASLPLTALLIMFGIFAGEPNVVGIVVLTILALMAPALPVFGWLLVRSQRDVAVVAGTMLGVVLCVIAHGCTFFGIMSWAVAGGMHV